MRAQKYLNINYPILIKKEIEDSKIIWVSEIPDLPGCWAQGVDPEESIEKIEEAKELWIKIGIKKGINIPELPDENLFSEKVLLRISPRLYLELFTEAKENNLDIGEHIRTVLERRERPSEIRPTRVEVSTTTNSSDLTLPPSVIGEERGLTYERAEI